MVGRKQPRGRQRGKGSTGGSHKRTEGLDVNQMIGCESGFWPEQLSVLCCLCEDGDTGEQKSKLLGLY